MKPNENIREFVVAYFECMLWSTTDHAHGAGGAPLDDNYGIDDIDPKSKRAAMRECIHFIEANATLLESVGTMEQHGHDYWLTRNGHGAGFWDRGYGRKGDKLSAAAKADGSVDPMVDDGKVYL